MSIYKTSRGWNGLDEEVSQIRRRAAQLEPSPAKPATQDWTCMRKAAPADFLLPLSGRWFKALPSDRAPRALVISYPRIANLIAAQWNEGRGAQYLLEDLLTDRRGGRKGFPAPVRDDLLRLREHWYSGTRRLGDTPRSDGKGRV